MARPTKKNSGTLGWQLATLAAALAAALAGCGGGGGSSAEPTAQPEATAGESLQFTLDAIDIAAAVAVEPLFHMAPVVLEAPDDTDADDPVGSVQGAAKVQAVPAAQAGLDSRALTLDAIERPSMQAFSLGGGSVVPLASSSTVTTYTPAQIRSAYRLPALPAPGATPSAEQAAQLGAGQTIYIVDAYHDPNAVAELAAFNQKFGLAGCTTQAIATNAKLPLAAASASAGCVFSVVYTNSAGTMTASAPAYHAGWATEIALDVQWAHATAPLARIVLIEAADASLNSLLGAIQLANKMGPGVVSMSFGAAEGSWTASVDSVFSAAGMSYLAATGDSGAAVSWPSVSTKVLAVGGTTLTAVGNGSRSETTWSRTGGGISQYVAAPSWQASGLPGVGSVPRRGVADVAFNADPASGQYVAVIAPGKTAASWLSAGGTSLSTPQWAGLIAIANAVRARTATAPLGAPHSVLYRQIGAVPGSYASVFADIASGADGSCALCTARAGYDVPTGLGTPNGSSLLSALTGSTPAAAAAPAVSAPVVGSSAVSGTAGTPLSFPITVNARNPVSYSLAGAPSGMTVSASGVVSWPNPSAGSWKVTATAKDNSTGLSGQGVYTLTIAAPPLPPVITASALKGVAKKSLSGTITFSDPAGLAMTVTLSGVPAGMVGKLSGSTLTLTWVSPVTGNYTMVVKATDSAGRSSTASVPVTITAK